MNWIDVDDRMPPPQMDVLVFCPSPYGNGNKRTARATYVERFSVPAPDDGDLDNDYYEQNPDDEEWYLREGWYESPVFGEVFEHISADKITHWMKIPTMHAET